MIVALANAIAADLNAGSFTPEFTAVRQWIADWTLSQLATLRVTVVPGPSQWNPLNRGRDDERHETDIVVQHKVSPSAIAEADALVAFVEEELVPYFFNKKISAGGVTARCTGRSLVPAGESAVNPEHFKTMHVFTGVLRTSWVRL